MGYLRLTFRYWWAERDRRQKTALVIAGAMVVWGFYVGAAAVPNHNYRAANANDESNGPIIHYVDKYDLVEQVLNPAPSETPTTTSARSTSPASPTFVAASAPSNIQSGTTTPATSATTVKATNTTQATTTSIKTTTTTIRSTSTTRPRTTTTQPVPPPDCKDGVLEDNGQWNCQDD